VAAVDGTLYKALAAAGLGCSVGDWRPGTPGAPLGEAAVAGKYAGACDGDTDLDADPGEESGERPAEPGRGGGDAMTVRELLCGFWPPAKPCCPLA